MVAYVALVYCTCQLMDVVGHVKIVLAPQTSRLSQEILPFVSMFNEILNSSVNLFIYIAASTTFRGDFCKYVLLR